MRQSGKFEHRFDTLCQEIILNFYNVANFFVLKDPYLLGLHTEIFMDDMIFMSGTCLKIIN